MRRQHPLNLVPHPLTALPLTLMASAAWAAWLGWDQRYDVQPDGSATGPYEAWQVIGLVLTLLAPLYWAASRNHIADAVLGITAGLTAAAFYDWSDDATGLFMIGVVLVAAGTFAATTAVTALIASLKRVTVTNA